MAAHADWLALVERDGLVVSEPVLEQFFPDGPRLVNAVAHHWFRRKAERFRVALGEKDTSAEKRADGARQWVDHLLEELLEHPASAWRKAAEVPPECQVLLPEFDQTLHADRVLMGPKGPGLLVSIVHPDQGLDRQDRREGRWKASPTTKLERLLRDTKHPLGLVTNGNAFRLMYAPPGFTAGHVTWSSRLLIEEKATRRVLHAPGATCSAPPTTAHAGRSAGCPLTGRGGRRPARRAGAQRPSGSSGPGTADREKHGQPAGDRDGV